MHIFYPQWDYTFPEGKDGLLLIWPPKCPPQWQTYSRWLTLLELLEIANFKILHCQTPTQKSLMILLPSDLTFSARQPSPSYKTWYIFSSSSVLPPLIHSPHPSHEVPPCGLCLFSSVPWVPSSYTLPIHVIRPLPSQTSQVHLLSRFLLLLPKSGVIFILSWLLYLYYNSLEMSHIQS